MARRGRNAFVGMRTRWTMESEEAWRVGHEAAWPVMRDVSVVTLVIALGAFAGLASSGDGAPEWLLPIVLIGGTLLWGLGMLVAAVVADRAARGTITHH